MKKNQSDDRIAFLRGPRVLIRPPLERDIPKLLVWFNDGEVNEFLQHYFPITEDFEREWLKNLGTKRRETDAVFVIETLRGQSIGTMGIHRIDWISRTATTGAAIGEKQFWGKGYGSEAKMLLLYYAFERLNLRRIYSSAFSFNLRSINYSQKCGYRIEARLKRKHFRAGKYHDEVILSISRPDWLPIWQRFQKTGRV